MEKAVADSADGTPAPYGHACNNCVRAKGRCTLRGPGMSCERCHRTMRDCQPSMSVRKKAANLKRKTRTAHLEEKIDDLVTLLKEQQPPKEGPGSDSIPGAGCSAAAHEVPSPESRHMQRHDPGQLPLPYPTQPSHNQSTRNLAAMSTDHLNATEAQDCLESFRAVYLPFMPLLVLPASVTWEELKQTSPVLWLCIVTVTTKVTLRHQTLGHRAKEVISTTIFVNGERDLEILLSILVLTTWSINPVRGKAYLWLLIHAAISLVDDLGIDRPRENLESRLSFSNITNQEEKRPKDLNYPLGEARAFLGCYISCSSMAGFFQRPNPMKWTMSLRKAADQLWTSGNQAGDRVLVAQLHLQRLLDDVATTPWHTRDIIDTADASATPHFHIQVLLDQLKTAREMYLSDPVTSKHTGLSLSARGTEIAIKELMTIGAPATRSLSEPLHLKRLELLNSCLHSIKLWFDEFGRIPLELYMGMPFRLFIDLPLCFQILLRLVTDCVPGWDRTAVMEVANPLSLLDELADRLVKIPLLMGVNGDGTDGDFYTKAARNSRGRRCLVASVLEQAGVLASGPENHVVGNGGVHPSAASEGGDLLGLMSFIDDTWMAEISGGGWERPQEP